MACQIPNAAGQEGSPSDWRDKHRSETACQGKHHHQYTGEMGCVVTTMETEEECPECTSVCCG